MVAVRKKLMVEQGQKLMFPELRYFFYITNKRDISAREVVRLANTRCDQERLFGVQKSEVKSFRCPLDSLLSNWAYMVCTTLAWNLSRWFGLVLPETGRWREKHSVDKQAVSRMNFATFVDAFMRVPTQVLRGARQIRLRLLSWNPWQRRLGASSRLSDLPRSAADSRPRESSPSKDHCRQSEISGCDPSMPKLI
jgi:hypothetical protein